MGIELGERHVQVEVVVDEGERGVLALVLDVFDWRGIFRFVLPSMEFCCLLGIPCAPCSTDISTASCGCVSRDTGVVEMSIVLFGAKPPGRWWKSSRRQLTFFQRERLATAAKRRQAKALRA